MNKISKKIVALVTMVAFVLTLVPVAAFAANATVAGSSYAVTSNAASTLEVVVTLDDSSDNTNVRLKVDFDGIDAEGVAVSSTNADSNGTTIEQLTSTGSTPDTSQTEITYTFTNVPAGAKNVTVNMSINSGTDYDPIENVTADGKGSAYVSNADRQTSYFLTEKSNVNVNVNDDVKAVFEINDTTGRPSAEGIELADVTVWAVEKGHDITDASSALVGGITKQSVADKEELTLSFSRAGEYTLYAGVGKDVETASKALLGSVEGQQVVVVNATAQKVASITLDGGSVTGSGNAWTASLDKANNAESNTHTVTVLDANGVPVANKTFTVTDNSSYLNLSGNSFTTDRNGEFEFSYTASREGEYKVYITSSDTERVILTVTVGDPVVREAETIVANEKDITLDLDQVNDEGNLLAAVTYTITDNNGNVVEDDQTSGILDAEGCLSGSVDPDYVKLLAKPDGFKGEATDFGLDYVNDTYTLAYTGGNLVAGDYTVRLILDNGNYADATFTVGEFDANAVKSLAVTTTSDTVEYDADGATITYNVLAVDANGVSRDITEDAGTYALGLNPASAAVTATAGAAGTVSVAFAADVDKEKVVGTEIQLVAASNDYGIAQTTVTIVDKGVVEGIEFDSTEGEVNKDNTVKASVVDADGNVVEGVTGAVFAYVADQSNADANVEVTPADNASKGVANITIFSDKETTVDIVVGIQDKSGDTDSPIYAATLTYTIGEADVNADTIVAMTIGSTDMIVNNEIIAGDAAPFVQDSRTYVPFRALGETFGAEVEWDQDAQTVTYVCGDTTIVMTIGETTYTVNDVEQSMDVAPVLTGDRTYVPVRFVAEAMGYKVTPLYAADGTTASVVFQK